MGKSKNKQPQFPSHPWKHRPPSLRSVVCTLLKSGNGVFPFILQSSQIDKTVLYCFLRSLQTTASSVPQWPHRSLRPMLAPYKKKSKFSKLSKKTFFVFFIEFIESFWVEKCKKNVKNLFIPLWGQATWDFWVILSWKRFK